MSEQQAKRQFVDECLKEVKVHHYFYYIGVGMAHNEAINHCWAVACVNVANVWAKHGVHKAQGTTKAKLYKALLVWTKELSKNVFNIANPRCFERKIKAVASSSYPDFYEVISKHYGNLNAKKFNTTQSKAKDYLLPPKANYNEVTEVQKHFAFSELTQRYKELISNN